MGKWQSFDQVFDGLHLDREIIVLCACWYLPYKLSFRDLVEMMSEHGLSLVHTTIMLASGDDFFRYTAMRAENNHYLSAQHGFVSITWYSDREGLVTGSTSIWKTAKDADAAYGSARFEAFAKMNIQPYVKARSIHVFELDKVK